MDHLNSAQMSDAEWALLASSLRRAPEDVQLALHLAGSEAFRLGLGWHFDPESDYSLLAGSEPLRTAFSFAHHEMPQCELRYVSKNAGGSVDAALIVRVVRSLPVRDLDACVAELVNLQRDIERRGRCRPVRIRVSTAIACVETSVGPLPFPSCRVGPDGGEAVHVLSIKALLQSGADVSRRCGGATT